MSRRRRQPASPPPHYQPLYEWALNAAGEPVHILEAAHGETYYCPVCGGRMVAKLGDIKQHHFAHETLQFCEPAEVAGAAASRWLAKRLQDCLDDERGIMVTWSCPLCHQPHTANILQDMTQVRQKYAHHDLESDIALLDAAGEVRVVLNLHKLTADVLRAYAQHKIMVIVVDLARGRFSDLAALLSGSRVYGGICTTQKSAALGGIVTDPADLRKHLVDVVSRPPYAVHGPLQKVNDLTHVFTLGDQKLWLPPILWQRAIGGLLHTINPALQVITQEWPQEDGSVIALYYVTVRDTHAIAVRRFPPGKPVYARLDSTALRSDRLAAAGVARGFAEL